MGLTADVSVNELRTLLQDTGVFSLLSDKELEQLTYRFRPVDYSFGQPVCRAGESAEAFFLIRSGQARVVAETDEGREVTLEVLKRGNSFGEKGLVTESRQPSTIRAMGELALLRLSRRDFERVLDDYPYLKGYLERASAETSIRDFLKRCARFSPLSAHEISDLLSCLQERDFARGEVIYREGQPADGFYILRSGSVKVVQEGERARTLELIKPGEAFGELALIASQARTTTAIAQEPSSGFRLEKSDFDRFMVSSAAFKTAMVTLASGYSDLPADEIAPARQVHTGELPPASPRPDERAYHSRRSRRYPALLQLSETDCGAACLAMILRYYGKQVSINRVRNLVNVGRDGATLHSLAEAAEMLGFHTRGIRADYSHLEKVDLPAIVHWEGFHFVVLYEVGAHHVVIADPSLGLRRLTREEFIKGWTGYLLCLSPTPKLEDIEESKPTIGRFLTLLKPYRRLMIEIFAASAVLQLFGLASPIFTQVIVDKVLVHKNVPMLNLMITGMLFIVVFQTATTALRYYLMVHTTQRLDLQMVVNFYRHILSLSLRYFEERKVGDILKRFNANTHIRELLTGRALSVVLDLMMISVYLALMCYYNAKLTMVALAFLPGYAALVLAITPKLKRQYREAFVRSAEADSSMVEAVSGVATIKANATERRVRWKLEGLMVKALNVQFRSALLGIAGQSIGNVLQLLSTISLLWYGAHLVMTDELSIGQLVAFNVLAGSVTRPILGIIDLWNEFQQVVVEVEQLNDVFDAQPEEDGKDGARIHLPSTRGHIRFTNVTFRYPTRPDKNALQNIQLEIQPGQTVALVGRSGAGKTTFANLLLRLHEPNEGHISIDGYDLKQLSLSSLRSQIGVVPQDIFLFSGTIRENIAFGNSDASLKEVVGAAMLAGAHEFISELPLGYETRIGERGQSLSGGQRQRIAIARALYRRPRILIFDEATSALDTESERAIQQNLRQILKDRTTLIIAHRLSTVRQADLIVVLDRGTIIEMGTHDSLMSQRGTYYYLNGEQFQS